MDIDSRIPRSLQELEQMAKQLAEEMCAPLLGRTVCTGVILQALMLMHRRAVRSMPADAQRDIGYAMAAYAGELIATPHAPAKPAHAPHQFHNAETPLQ